MNPLARLFAMLACVTLSALSDEARSQNAEPPEADFADFLCHTDLVVTGTVTGFARIVAGGRNTCTGDSTAPFGARQAHVKVDSVLLGSLGDTTIWISGLSNDSNDVVGKRVVAWANRICESSWNLWGGLTPVREDETVWNPKQGALIPLDSLLSAVDRCGDRTGLRAFEGTDGVATVRLRRHILGLSPGRFSYECDSVGWILPTEARVPRRIDWIIPPECSPYFGPGDTILVPIESGSRGQDALTHSCPRAWVVEHGFARGFGLPLSEVSRAFRRDETGIHVRSFWATPAATPVPTPRAPLRPSRGSARSRGAG
jgi:hypothetical protein